MNTRSRMLLLSAILVSQASLATDNDRSPPPDQSTVAKVPAVAPVPAMREIADIPVVPEVQEVPPPAEVRGLGMPTPAPGPDRELAPPQAGDYQELIRDDHERNTLYFTWAPAHMDPRNRLLPQGPEDHYRVCLFIGDSCESAATRQVFEVTPGVREIPPYRYRLSDHGLKADLAFQETRFNWAVAACIRETGQCSGYSPALPIHWSQPRLPVLVFPKADATQDPMSKLQFRWRATADVDHYLLCLAKPDLGCPNEPTAQADKLSVIALPNTRPYAYLEELLAATSEDGTVTPYQRARLHGQQMQWTAAVCRDGQCEYRPEARSITFDRGLANINVRNISSQDIDALWLLGPGEDDRTLVTHDLSTTLAPNTLAFVGGRYDDNYLVRVQRHHLGVAEPNVAPYYRFEYALRQPNSTATTVAFAPGISHLPQYQVERETLFISDAGSYFEQILRGPDERRYVYRPGGSFEGHAEAGPGPVLLQTLRDEGYRFY